MRRKPRLVRISQTMHDRCLRAAIDRKADLTPDEHLALNIVAGNYASSEDCTVKEMEAVRAILGRLGL